MTYLTIARIQKIIAKDKRIDQTLDIVEDTVSIWTKDGYAFDLGEDRHVENLRVGDYHPDTVEYLKTCLANIEKE
jgi:5,10-methenyltetrahydromethanopterin hydrogenase